MSGSALPLCGVLLGVLRPLQSSVSGASEAMQYLMAFVIVGSAAAVRRTGKTGWLVIGAAACALETIFRPYALLFWVFPLTAVWQHKKRRCVCLCGSGGLVCPVDFFDDKDGGSVFRRRHGFCRCAAAFAGSPDSGCAL